MATRCGEIGLPVPVVRSARDDESPKAVVLLFGWLGAEDRHLAKYANMWADAGAASVRATASSADIMLGNEARLRGGGLAVLRAAAPSLAEAPNATLIAHCFSNGGAFVYEQLRLAMSEAAAGEGSGLSPEDAACLASMRARLAAEVFDSCPCYLHLGPGLRAIGTAVPLAAPRLLLQAVFGLYVVCSTGLAKLGLVPLRPETYWKHWLTPPATSTSTRAPRPRVRSLYAYSTVDDLCDVEALEALIHTRVERGEPVCSLRFEDCSHVSLLPAHPEAYASACAKLAWPA